MSSDKDKREPRITVRKHNNGKQVIFGKEDWRGALAIIIWAGFFILLGIPLVMRDLEAVKTIASVL